MRNLHPPIAKQRFGVLEPDVMKKIKQPDKLAVPTSWRDKTSAAPMLGIVGESRRERFLRLVLADNPKLTREEALEYLKEAGG